MHLDESITTAFETIREFTSFDSHSLVPHPENLVFQTITESRFLHRLGTKLAEIVSSPDSEDLQYAAHVVKRHFWNELGLSQPPELATEVPRFLLKPDHKIEPRTDPQELASQLAAVHAGNIRAVHRLVEAGAVAKAAESVRCSHQVPDVGLCQ